MDNYLKDILRRNVTKKRILGKSLDISKKTRNNPVYMSQSLHTIASHKNYIKKNMEALTKNYKLDEIKDKEDVLMFNENSQESEINLISPKDQIVDKKQPYMEKDENKLD